MISKFKINKRKYLKPLIIKQFTDQIKNFKNQLINQFNNQINNKINKFNNKIFNKRYHFKIKLSKFKNNYVKIS